MSVVTILDDFECDPDLGDEQLTVGVVCAAALRAIMVMRRMGKFFVLPATDFENNIIKLKNGAREASGLSGAADVDAVTVGSILNSEIQRGKQHRDPSGTVGALWLKRGLENFYCILRQLVDGHADALATGHESLTRLVQNAYALSLQRHHTWLMAQAFKLASRGTPARTQVLLQLLTRPPSSLRRSLSCEEADGASGQAPAGDVCTLDQLDEIVSKISRFLPNVVHVIGALDQLLLSRGLEDKPAACLDEASFVDLFPPAPCDSTPAAHRHFRRTSCN